jgi:glycolate oxidase FAD binding subunit
MAGSWGTLAVLTQVNLRTAPLPEAEETLLVRGLDERAAVARMTAALKSPAAVSGAAHLPADVAGALAAVASGGASLTALRVEGTPASVKARREMLEAAGGDLAVAAGETSRALWREIANAEPLAEPAGAAVWRFTVEPGLAAMIAQGLRERHGARVLMDWAGGLLTVALPQLALTEAAELAAPVWEAIPKGRGQAMLLRGSAALRETPFPPMEPGLAALNARVKRSFDPSGVLNPGRMYEGF